MSILLTLHILPKHESQWPQNSLLMCYRIIFNHSPGGYLGCHYFVFYYYK